MGAMLPMPARATSSGLIAALVLGVASAAAAEQSFPQRPLKLMVGFTAGGPADAVARIAAEVLSEGLGKPVIVENRAGAGGTLAAAAAAAAAADGYTLLVNATSDVINSIISKQAGYDIETSFAPIGLIASAPNVLVVHPSVPANSVRELVEYARAHPGALNYGSAGFGTVSHLAAAQFAAIARVQCVHVPYKGTAAAQIDLLSGRLQFMFDSMVSALANAKAGKVRALAVTSAARWPGSPDLPGMAESGFPGFDMLVWFGLLAPAGTPAPVVSRVAEVLSKGLQDAEVRKRIAALGAEPGHMTPAELGRYIRTENMRWKKLFADGLVTVNE
jgi:tripartite-type tricarboxylate transporter receptor subunit TctC